MRVRKLIRRLVATPMKKSHFLLAILGSRLVFTLPEVVIMLVVGWLFFGMSIRGGVLAIVVLAFIGAAAFSGLGLLLASRARTIESVSGLMNAAMLPMWILSGTFFSADRFPAAVQPLVQALPLTHLNEAFRAVILEGASLASQGVHVAVLVAWGVVTFFLALLWFRWS
jgi:ABC-type multidrug transport system permease subunit